MHCGIYFNGAVCSKLISSWICPIAVHIAYKPISLSRASNNTNWTKHTAINNIFNIFCKYLFHTKRNIILNACLIKWKQEWNRSAIINFLAKKGVHKSGTQNMNEQRKKWKQTHAQILLSLKRIGRPQRDQSKTTRKKTQVCSQFGWFCVCDMPE